MYLWARVACAVLWLRLALADWTEALRLAESCGRRERRGGEGGGQNPSALCRLHHRDDRLHYANSFRAHAHSIICSNPQQQTQTSPDPFGALCFFIN